MTGCKVYCNQLTVIFRNENNLGTWNTRNYRNGWKYSKGNRRFLTVQVMGSHRLQLLLTKEIWGDADKSLARPGMKQATATKLGIYSTYSPRSSIHFLVRCSNFCKPLKKNQNAVCPTRSPRQQWPPRRKRNGHISIVFSFQGTDTR